MRRTIRVFALVAIAMMSSLLFGQTPTGTILGTIRDSSGAVVPEVNIAIVEVNTNAKRITRSNSLGYYEVPLLLPGTYQVQAEHAGFERFIRSNLKLDADQKMEIDVVLHPGTVKQTVQVTGEGPLLQTTASAVGQVIENRFVRDLPLSNRNILQLNTLVPGVYDFGAGTAPADSGSVGFGRWSSNGGMTNSNGFMLDGATAILGNMNAASIIPTLDSVEEFKIQTDAMSAEYGRTGGAIINAVTKSGTNHLHGTVYEFWKNRVLNANTWVNNKNGAPKSFQNVNTYGFSLGGPVYIPKVYDGRNRLFFFTSYEGYRDVLPVSSLLTVPTAQEKNGDFSQLRDQKGNPINIYNPLTTTPVAGSPGVYTRQQFTGNIIPTGQIDPVAASLIKYYPSPNTTPENPFTDAGNYLAILSGHDTQNEFSEKVDANISTSKRLFVRYTQSSQGGGAANYFGSTPACSGCLVHNNPAGAVSARGGGSSLFVYPKNAVVGFTDVLSPTTVLDVRYSMNRQFLSRLPQSSGFDLTSVGFPQQLASSIYYAMFPPISIQNYQGLGTNSNGDLLRRGDLTHAVQGSVTIIRGAHTIKAGGDFRLFRYNDLQAYNTVPAFSFNQVWTQQNPFASAADSGWGLASFLLGTPASGVFTIPASTSIQWYYTAGYIQDSWRVTHSLTLNLGLRYDLETPFTERYNRTSIFDPTVTSVATQRDPSAVGGLQFMGKDIASRHRNPTNFHNFAPRVGLAYKVNSSLVLRAAYGIFFQPTMVYGYGAPVFGTNGYQQDTDMVTSQDGGLTPSQFLSNPFPAGFLQPTGNSLGALTDLGQSIQSQLENGIRSPYVQEYNAGFQYQLKSFLFDVGYMGSRGIHQVINAQLDQLLPSLYAEGNQLNQQVANPFLGLVQSGPFANATLSYGQLQMPFPQFTGVADNYQTSGDMNYNSLQIKVEHRLSKGVSLLAGYTWSKNLGNVGERYWNNTSYQNAYDPAAEYALSPFDISQKLTFGYVWQLPFGKGQPLAHFSSGFLNQLVSGWQINGLTTIESGEPLRISNPVNVVGFGAGSRPNALTNPMPSGFNRTPSQWFDTSAYSEPTQFTFGNEPPYDPVLRGPGVNTWDVSFFKDARVGEHVTLQFRGEFYNFFNHPIWNAPGTTVGTPTFGEVLSKSGNRTGQLALKLIF